jgi:hypothetical protein
MSPVYSLLLHKGCLQISKLCAGSKLIVSHSSLLSEKCVLHPVIKELKLLLSTKLNTAINYYSIFRKHMIFRKGRTSIRSLPSSSVIHIVFKYNSNL